MNVISWACRNALIAAARLTAGEKSRKMFTQVHTHIYTHARTHELTDSCKKQNQIMEQVGTHLFGEPTYQGAKMSLA